MLTGDAPRVRLGPIVAVLCFLLVVWRPLTLASMAAGGLTRLLAHGAPALLLLVLRVLETGLGVAAGRALWQRRRGAVALAHAYLAASTVGTVLTFSTPYFPSNRPPGAKRVALAATLALNAGWAGYLVVSPHVARLYRSEDEGRPAVEPMA